MFFLFGSLLIFFVSSFFLERVVVKKSKHVILDSTAHCCTGIEAWRSAEVVRMYDWRACGGGVSPAMQVARSVGPMARRHV